MLVLLVKRSCYYKTGFSRNPNIYEVNKHRSRIVAAQNCAVKVIVAAASDRANMVYLLAMVGEVRGQSAKLLANFCMVHCINLHVVR